MSKSAEVIVAEAFHRQRDGLRQIEDIVGRCVSNPGLESNVVEMVSKLADKHDALERENAKLMMIATWAYNTGHTPPGISRDDHARVIGVPI